MMMMIIIYEDHADDLKTFLLFCLLFSIDCSDHQVRSIVRWQKGVRAKKIQVKNTAVVYKFCNIVNIEEKQTYKKFDVNTLFASQRKRGQRRKRKGILGSRGFKFNQVARRWRCRLCA